MKPEQREVLVECRRRMRLVDSNGSSGCRKYDVHGDAGSEQTHGPLWHMGEWFGGGQLLPGGRRYQYVKAVRTLVAAGLVVPFAPGGKKVTNIKLTAAGIDEAERLEGVEQ